MTTPYEGRFDKRIYPRFDVTLNVYFRLPLKGGGHKIEARVSKNLSQAGVGVFTENLGLDRNKEYDVAVVNKYPGQDNVVRVHMFKASSRHTTSGVTGFSLVKKTQPAFA